jgi:hypothetical protein
MTYQYYINNLSRGLITCRGCGFTTNSTSAINIDIQQPLVVLRDLPERRGTTLCTVTEVKAKGLG